MLLCLFLVGTVLVAGARPAAGLEKVRDCCIFREACILNGSIQEASTRVFIHYCTKDVPCRRGRHLNPSCCLLRLPRFLGGLPLRRS